MQWLCGQTARDNATLVAYAISQFEERLTLEEQRQRQVKDETTHKDLMHYLLNNADPKTGLRPTRAELEGDTLSLIGAGADTVATVLPAALFYLVRNPSSLDAATSEVRSAFKSLEEIVSGPQMDSCVYLHACIEETLRLAPPVTAPLPREVMKGGIVIDGHHIPEGVVVGVAAYVVHHDAEAFPQPWAFRPERWILPSKPHLRGSKEYNSTNNTTIAVNTDGKQDTKDNNLGVGVNGNVSKEALSRARQAMCPFSLGGRGCIGKQLAYIELRITLAALLWSYDLQEVNPVPRPGVPGAPRAPGEGRENVDEYRLIDCFGADRDGPVLRFRARKDERL
jgi:cytochrome P450